MSDLTLFPGPDPTPAPPSTTAGQRLRARQSARIQAGMHPLDGVVTNLRLHPDAARPVENDGHGTDPHRCGSCLHRRPVGGHAKDYPKCLHGYTATPIPESERKPNGPTLRIRMPRVTHGAASDVRAWWPACVDWAPAEEGSTS